MVTQQEINQARSQLQSRQRDLAQQSKQLRSQQAIRNLSLQQRQQLAQQLSQQSQVLSQQRQQVESASSQLRQATLQRDRLRQVEGRAIERVREALSRGAGGATRADDSPELRAAILRISEQVNLKRVGEKALTARFEAAQELGALGLTPQETTTLLREGGEVLVPELAQSLQPAFVGPVPQGFSEAQFRQTGRLVPQFQGPIQPGTSEVFFRETGQVLDVPSLPAQDSVPEAILGQPFRLLGRGLGILEQAQEEGQIGQFIPGVTTQPEPTGQPFFTQLGAVPQTVTIGAPAFAQPQVPGQEIIFEAGPFTPVVVRATERLRVEFGVRTEFIRRGFNVASPEIKRLINQEVERILQRNIQTGLAIGGSSALVGGQLQKPLSVLGSAASFLGGEFERRARRTAQRVIPIAAGLGGAITPPSASALGTEFGSPFVPGISQQFTGGVQGVGTQLGSPFIPQATSTLGEVRAGTTQGLRQVGIFGAPQAAVEFGQEQLQIGRARQLGITPEEAALTPAGRRQETALGIGAFLTPGAGQVLIGTEALTGAGEVIEPGFIQRPVREQIGAVAPIAIVGGVAGAVSLGRFGLTPRVTSIEKLTEAEITTLARAQPIIKGGEQITIGKITSTAKIPTNLVTTQTRLGRALGRPPKRFASRPGEIGAEAEFISVPVRSEADKLIGVETVGSGFTQRLTRKGGELVEITPETRGIEALSAKDVTLKKIFGFDIGGNAIANLDEIAKLKPREQVLILKALDLPGIPEGSRIVTGRGLQSNNVITISGPRNAEIRVTSPKSRNVENIESVSILKELPTAEGSPRVFDVRTAGRNIRFHLTKNPKLGKIETSSGKLIIEKPIILDSEVGTVITGGKSAKTAKGKAAQKLKQEQNIQQQIASEAAQVNLEQKLLRESTQKGRTALRTQIKRIETRSGFKGLPTIVGGSGAVGAFAGTGQYERTSEGVIVSPIGREIGNQPLSQSQVKNLRFTLDLPTVGVPVAVTQVAQQQSILQQQQLQQQQKLNQTLADLGITSPALAETQITIPGQRQPLAQRQALIPRTAQQQRLVQAQVTPVPQVKPQLPRQPTPTTIPKIPKVPPPIILPEESASFRSGLKKLKKQSKAFDVLVKRGGKFVKVADDLRFNRAQKRLSEELRNTLAAEGKLIPDKGKKPKSKRDIKFSLDVANFRDFRIKSGTKIPLPLGQFIERKNKRIKSAGEIAEILRAQRKGGKKRKKKKLKFDFNF